MYDPTCDYTLPQKSLPQQAQGASTPRPSLDITHLDSRFSTYSCSSRHDLVVHLSTNLPRQARPAHGHGTLKDRWFNDPFMGWRRLLFGSWLNLLLLIVPVAWILSIHFKDTLPGLVFIFCTIALVPLIKMHEVATRELSLRIGGSKAGLVNASLSNVVETVVAIIALRKCELRVVQSSLIGSIISKLLLILGLCFFAGGMRSSEQIFDITANQINSSLLTVSVGVLVFPAAFHFALSGRMDSVMPRWQQSDILQMSRGVSVVLIFIYMLYLLFQLVSHSHLYEDLHKKNKRLSRAIHSEAEKLKMKILHRSPVCPETSKDQWLDEVQPKATLQDLSSTDSLSHSPPHAAATVAQATPATSIVSRASSSNIEASCAGSVVSQAPPRTAIFANHNLSDATLLDKPSDNTHLHFRQENHIDLEKGFTNTTHREPEISWFLLGASLIFVTVAVAFTADWLVESMDGISKTLNKSWIALVLLPTVSSIAECSTAIGASFKDQLTLSINVAVGSSIQTAFFVLPLMVNIAWMMGKPLSLLFDPFDALILYISVQTMSHVVGDGKSNWLEGAILICLYIIIAVCLWFYPGSSLPNSLSVCT